MNRVRHGLDAELPYPFSYTALPAPPLMDISKILTLNMYIKNMSFVLDANDSPL
jgi:hypothetical protein